MQVSGFFKTPQGQTIEIREVWANNLDEEMDIIQEILEKYPYVAMVIYVNYILIIKLFQGY